MAKLSAEQVQDYLDRFRSSLRLSSDQSQAIVDEVRDDLLAHVRRLVEKGTDESAAVALAIEELGPPEELARQIKMEVPPLNSPAVRAIRMLGTVALAALFAYVCWDFRANVYGFSWVRPLAMVSLFLSLVLITWPGIMWRKNWMFTAIPAGCVLLLTLFMMTLGASQTVSGLAPAPRLSYLIGYAILGLMTALTIYLLAMMQRRRQQIAALGLALLLVALIELPYAWEESRFASQLQQMQAYLERVHQQNGAYPEKNQLDGQPVAAAFHYSMNPDGSGYNLYWSRPINSGYALCYGSQGDRFWIND